MDMEQTEPVSAAASPGCPATPLLGRRAEATPAFPEHSGQILNKEPPARLRNGVQTR